MREKYIEEEFEPYFIHGVHADGRVDVVQLNGGDVCTVTPAEANKLIQQRDAITQKLVKTALRFSEVDHEEFLKFWYFT